MTGFCATDTTFSTLILESARLISNGQIVRALANYLGSGVCPFNARSGRLVAAQTE